MIAELQERNPETTLDSLLDMVASMRYEEAEKLATDLKQKHTQAINSPVASTDETMKAVLAVDDIPVMLAGINEALKQHYKVFGVKSGEISCKWHLVLMHIYKAVKLLAAQVDACQREKRIWAEHFTPVYDAYKRRVFFSKSFLKKVPFYPLFFSYV
jgi:hypothetical protein